LPIVGVGVGHLLYVLTGHAPLPIPGDIAPILFVLFFLVIGEEIGWRGFMLRILLGRRSPLVSTAIVAVVWAVWHSPLYFIPGMPSYGQPFLAFAAWVVPLSFLLTWLWLGTQSAWLATIMHGSANLAASIAFPLDDPGTFFAFSAAGLAIVAIPLVVASWSPWTASPKPEPEVSPAPALATEG
jgi:membrane protease YdiL (CAAX protease family)